MQVVGLGLREGSGVPERVRPSRLEPEPGPSRRAYFGAAHGWVDTRVLRRSDLAAQVRGPTIIEEYDSTTIVTPGATAQLDNAGNIVIEIA
jgi:N-methylhydantoinase A